MLTDYKTTDQPADRHIQGALRDGWDDLHQDGGAHAHQRSSCYGCGCEQSRVGANGG